MIYFLHQHLQLLLQKHFHQSLLHIHQYHHRYFKKSHHQFHRIQEVET
jgi:hypothetical protein